MSLRLLAQWLGWLLVLAIAAVTLSPIELRPVTVAPAKWERFAAFMAIGALLCLGYPQQRWRIVVLIIGLAGLLEVLQHASPSRHGRLPDGLVKAAGALLGIVLGVMAERMLERLRTRSRPGRDVRATFLGTENRPPARACARNQ